MRNPLFLAKSFNVMKKIPNKPQGIWHFHISGIFHAILLQIAKYGKICNTPATVDVRFSIRAIFTPFQTTHIIHFFCLSDLIERILSFDI